MDENEMLCYIEQLEEENLRLKNSIKSLRNNNKGMLEGMIKLQKTVAQLKIRIKELETL